MTKEEAINKWVIPAIKNTWNEKKCTEIVKALEQEPCADCISRQAVMDALCNKCELFHKNGEQTCLTKCESYHFLATLPSVNPTSNVSIQITEREKYGRFN